jgi:hypothetical protein
LFFFPPEVHRFFRNAVILTYDFVDDSLLGGPRLAMKLKQVSALNVKHKCYQCAILATRQTYDQVISNPIERPPTVHPNAIERWRIFDESAEYVRQGRERH